MTNNLKNFLEGERKDTIICFKYKRHINHNQQTKSMNDRDQPMQEVIYKGKRIQFSKYMNPGNEQHLTMVAENHFKTKKLEDKVI